MMSWSQNIVRCLIVLGYAWMISFVLVGGSSSGKSFFENLASNSFPIFEHDGKGGTAIIMLSLPVLIATTLGTLIINRRLSPLSSKPCGGGAQSRFQAGVYLFMFLIMPFVVYIGCNIYRHLHGKDVNLKKKTKEIANAFGMAAVLCLSFILLPVARHGLLFFGWNPARIIQFHKWVGQFLVFCVFVHGGFHLYRFRYLLQEPNLFYLIYPSSCFNSNNSDDDGGDDDDDSSGNGSDGSSLCAVSKECSCDHQVRNLTGVLAGIGFLVILLASRGFVRRYSFRIFYTIHVSTVPITILFVLLHYKRANIFFAPSFVYYISTTFPVLLEKAFFHKKPVEVVSAERLPSNGQKRDCISLTIKGSPSAMRQYQPGCHVFLESQSCGQVAHSFTINRVPKKRDELRIIFRCVGPFTTQLAQKLLTSDVTQPKKSQPIFYVHGFKGADVPRLNQIYRHDASIIVAGGIGITPYLTLLHDIAECSKATANNHSTTNDTRVVLYWSCRDRNLIDYVQKHYFQTLESTANVKIFIYHSTASSFGDNKDNNNMSSYGEGDVTEIDGADHPEEKFIKDDDPDLEEEEPTNVASNKVNYLRNEGTPFVPTRFEAGMVPSYIHANLIPFLSFVAIAWPSLAVIWYFYSIQDSIWQRTYGSILAIAIALLVAFIVNLLPSYASQNRRHDGKMFKQLKTNDDEYSNRSSRRSSSSGLSESELNDVDDDDDGGGIEEDVQYCKIEMNTLKNRSGQSSDENNEMGETFDDENVKNLEVVEISESTGRPNIEKILKKELNYANNAGVFSCGPNELMKEVNEVAMQIGTRVCAPSTVTLYEESFCL